MNQKIYNKIASVCARKEMCKADAEQYLRRCNVDTSEFEEIIDELVKNNFIDEQRFAKAFVNDSYKYNKWGVYKITYMLRAKFIPEDIITNSLQVVDTDEYSEIADGLAQNKRKMLQDRGDDDVEAKVRTYLFSRGFLMEG